MLTLFAADVPAATPPGTPWWVTVGIGAIATAGGFLLRAYSERQKRLRAELVEDRTDERKHTAERENAVIAGQNDLIERLKAAHAEDKKAFQTQLTDLNREIGTLRAKLEETIARQQRAEKLTVRYEMRIQHLEEILESRQIPFKPMKDDDSGVMSAPPQPTHDKEPF